KRRKKKKSNTISEKQTPGRGNVVCPKKPQAAAAGDQIGRVDTDRRSPLFTLTASLMRRQGLRFCVSAADLFAAAERLQGSPFVTRPTWKRNIK
ncbi:MAG: hypothetical protein OXE52_04855, partial [Chloroflexi bacterium]|nr:hypothetical protein [Chloroflexota bacterium]